MILETPRGCPPRVSVVMPVFNGADFIAEALDSVLAQTCPAQEIIVVDDASQDGTGEVLRTYGDRIRVIRNAANGGPGFCRNRGIEGSTGTYIAFLDHDDLWLPRHLEQLCGLLDRWPEVGVAFSRLINFGTKSGEWPPLEAVPAWGEPVDMFLPLMRAPYFMPSGTMIRRSLYMRVGAFDEQRPFYFDDADFFCRAALVTRMIGAPEPTGRYRWHDAQPFRKNWIPGVLKYFECRERLLDAMRTEPGQAARIPAAQERTARQWEQFLETAWQQRRLDGLRDMVAVGARRGYLAAVTQAYVVRARVPSWLVTVVDRLRGRAPAGASGLDSR